MSDRVAKIVAAIVGAVLIGLGVFVIATQDEPGPVAPEPAPTAAVAGSGDQVVTPSTPPAGTETGSNDVTFPLDQGDVNAAAALASRFTARYLTYKYDQDDAAYTADLKRMLSPDPILNLSQTVPTGAAKAAMVKQRHTSTAAVSDVRADVVARTFAVFTVTANVSTRSGGTTATDRETYVVTLANDRGWGVSNIERPATNKVDD